ncbi:murein biosynthesis integral membrane protein MurJ [Candidatus Campbellbacteria bacterium RIFCSPLOWO2_01_FULL_34_15]|uniref:Murein biosynthesis integral membrane protein MurJ n=2 Tax=Candidatus Campbelliibacteriota TaxID=1752727 RepID=A0A1F5EP32_9BACT|nr:MAG: murein biosynthesis integral membrane protein MurJ [Candidatus Campbellbacteria bacterium RIFCSPHIGHO2_01_FULL_34_10]OGD69006.1 MAG: murein biosynthesis integral membrane protein MurJ [Candidatus Campbellbacteria bacterium RIFCSPLOWO2_01_FULL_34_15]
MVKRIIKLLNREISGLHEAAYLLGAFTFASQLLALVRDRALASFFGAGETLDIYYAAFRIPDFIFITVASIVSISVLIPFLADKSREENGGMQNFIDGVFTVFFGFISLVSLVVFFLAPFIVEKMFPGFGETALTEAISLTRILLLSPILLGLSNLFASIIQLNRKFLIYAISPVLYNLGIIFGIYFLYPSFGLNGLGAGVVLGAFLHLIIQIPVASSVGLLPKFTSKINYKDIKKVTLLSLPRTLTMSANQIAFFFLVALASSVGVGSIAVFNLSFNIQSVPMGIIGVSYSVAAFPTLARLFSAGEKQKFLNQMISASRHIIFWSLPALSLFIVLRAQIVRTILGSGQFDWSDTRLTAACLAMFAFSVTAQSLILLFIRGYYAMGNTKRPLLINISSSLSIIVFAFLFSWLFEQYDVFRYFVEHMFRVEDLFGTTVLMLAFSYSLGTMLNAILLMVMFEKDFDKFIYNISKTFWHSLFTSIIMGFVAYRFLTIFGDFLNLNTLQGIFMQGLFSGLAGILSGIFILWIMDNRELKEARKAFNKRVWKSGIVIPEKREL